jgi:endonuclease/exonuclease/phosphatase family metal-dependent hydrolase
MGLPSKSPRRGVRALAFLPVGVALAGLAACAAPSSARVALGGAGGASCPSAAADVESLRVATYNIQSGRSSSLDGVAAALSEMDADLVALQEVQRGVNRSAPVDQVRSLASTLGMYSAYAPAKKKGAGDFGVAVLSRLPVLAAERVPLPARMSGEPRVALDVTVCAGPRPLRFVAVHGDVMPWAATANSEHVAEMVAGTVGDGVIVAGDLNMRPGAAGPLHLQRVGLVDVVADHAEGPTFPTRPGPEPRRIDYLFLDSPLADAVRAVRIPDTVASDHFPILADIDLSRWARR